MIQPSCPGSLRYKTKWNEQFTGAGLHAVSIVWGFLTEKSGIMESPHYFIDLTQLNDKYCDSTNNDLTSFKFVI